MGRKTILNISGHPLSYGASEKLSEFFDNIEDVKFKLIDFNEDIIPQIEKIIDQIRTPLDGTISITIIVPSHSTFALTLTIYLEGLLGSFPDICLLDPNENGIYYPKLSSIYNGNLIRKKGREKRLSKWSDEII